MNSVFKKSIELNNKIQKFLDTISNSLLLFEKFIKAYLTNDFITAEEVFERISFLETEADHLETDIKVSLYKFMLLPDTRADVLSLVKSLDNIIDATEAITKDFLIQKPCFPNPLHKELLDLTTNSLRSADNLLIATRAFFSEAHLVSSYINHINFYEHETDILEEKVNRIIFGGQYVKELAEKLQLKYFVNEIASISDEAEKTGEKLTIFAIKREI